MQISLTLTFSVNVYPGRQHGSGAVDQGLALVPPRELYLESVDFKHTASHQHPVLQTQILTLTLGLGWT